jgi:hypothetical protein
VAGGAWAAVAVGWWLSPVLILLSVGLLSRSFYILYVQKRGTTTVKVLTWSSATFIVCFWTWWLVLKP